MKWWPGPLKAGDMIRVSVGSVYHYGIFVGEDEVIQFGPPPTAQAMKDCGDFRVMASDIHAFCGGVIVEVAVPETRAERRRFSARKTVKRARAAMGNTGYDIIRNNCEHFAYECVYGVKHSTQAEEARRRFYDRPLLHVYVLPISDGMTLQKVYPRARDAEIRAACGDAALQKYAAWLALEKGFSHAFGVDIRLLTFQKNRSGKWTSDRYAFSISHTKGAVAVALSHADVGVDMENEADFSRLHASSFEKLWKDMVTPEEHERIPEPTEKDFLSLWTRKESAFKRNGHGKFDPRSVNALSPTIKTVSFDAGGPMVLSVCGDKLDTLSVYILSDGGNPCRLDTQDREWDQL